MARFLTAEEFDEVLATDAEVTLVRKDGAYFYEGTDWVYIPEDQKQTAEFSRTLTNG